jgi:ferredoxin-NADP reductase
MLFRFEKPEGFTYKAGQNSDFTLIEPLETDPEGNKRTFSLVTTPAEDHLAITTRMRDTAFKRTLRVMEDGTKLTIEGPYGDLTLHENTARPAVFLAGGIGITPFHSMVRDATERALLIPLPCSIPTVAPKTPHSCRNLWIFQRRTRTSHSLAP